MKEWYADLSLNCYKSPEKFLCNGFTNATSAVTRNICCASECWSETNASLFVCLCYVVIICSTISIWRCSRLPGLVTLSKITERREHYICRSTTNSSKCVHRAASREGTREGENVWFFFQDDPVRHDTAIIIWSQLLFAIVEWIKVRKQPWATTRIESLSAYLDVPIGKELRLLCRASKHRTVRNIWVAVRRLVLPRQTSVCMKGSSHLWQYQDYFRFKYYLHRV